MEEMKASPPARTNYFWNAMYNSEAMLPHPGHWVIIRKANHTEFSSAKDSIELLLKLVYLVSAVFLTSECTIDLNMAEMQYLADHLTQEECHRLVAALHFPTFDMPQKVAAAERKLPMDLPCLELLLHWNSEPGEGKGGTHVEVCHRLNQIGRRDLAQWLSKTVFHELSKDLDDSVVYLVTTETSRSPPMRVTEGRKNKIEDESPWLNLDSILALLVVLTIVTCATGAVYLSCLCCARIRNESKQKMYKKTTKDRTKTEKPLNKKQVQSENKYPKLSSSEDETAKLITNNKISKTG